MAFTSLAGVASLLSGMLNAKGQLQANRKNKETAAALGQEVGDLLTLGQPIGESALAGYAPGGFLRSALTNLYRQQAEQGVTGALASGRANAWRYGGAGSGVAKRGWRDALMAAAGQVPEQQADLESMDVLGRMMAAQRGYTRALEPYTIAENPYGWVYPAIQGASAGYSGGMGKGVYGG